MKQKTLHFSVEGEFITNLAREKLYYNNDLFGAVQLLLSCLTTDALTEATRIGIAVKILDGKMKIVGTYPNADYRVVEDTNDNEKFTLKYWLEGFTKRLKDAETSRDRLLRQMNFLQENIGRSDRQYYNRLWQDEVDEDSKIFDIEPLRSTHLFKAMGIDDKDPVSSFMERYHSPTTDDYGWLEQNGTFHPTDWGEHQNFAYKWLKEHDELPPDEFGSRIFNGNEGDILTEKGWILLHNPALGMAIVTRDTSKRMTKQQKEFLFDYYTKRNRTDLAAQYLKGDD